MYCTVSLLFLNQSTLRSDQSISWHKSYHLVWAVSWQHTSTLRSESATHSRGKVLRIALPTVKKDLPSCAWLHVCTSSQSSSKIRLRLTCALAWAVLRCVLTCIEKNNYWEVERCIEDKHIELCWNQQPILWYGLLVSQQNGHSQAPHISTPKSEKNVPSRLVVITCRDVPLRASYLQSSLFQFTACYVNIGSWWRGSNRKNTRC